MNGAWFYFNIQVFWIPRSFKWLGNKVLPTGNIRKDDGGSKFIYRLKILQIHIVGKQRVPRREFGEWREHPLKQLAPPSDAPAVVTVRLLAPVKIGPPDALRRYVPLDVFQRNARYVSALVRRIVTVHQKGDAALAALLPQTGSDFVVGSAKRP